MNVTPTYNKNSNLTSSNVKNKILKYLYGNVKNDIKPENIANEKDLKIIRDGNYIICPRFSGTRSWIIFIQIGETYYAVNFPKYNRKKMDIFIHPIEINVSKEFYYGTIMEGIYFQIAENKYLVVDEVYILAGEDQLLKAKDDRLNDLSKYIIKNSIHNPNFNMFVSQFFQMNKDNLKELYQKIKDDNKIQEIIFYPKVHGRKIYCYTIMDRDLTDHVIRIMTFRMQKMPSADVYNLIDIASGNKIGIAYIPDKETSKQCKRWFKENKAKELLVKCQMHNEKKKWIPMELVEENVDDLDNDRKIIEV